MTQIVNNDKLTFILTQYGLDRVAEALADPSVNLYITKIKLGSGDNYEYYEPQVQQTELKGLISGYEFPITDKELLEDELTVSFHAVITEDFGGYDIREVGLYETIDDVDYLFAVGTQQPFVKPAQADRYLISVDYYLFLKSQNFADVYDSIILDPESQLITKENLEDLMSTILFAQGNLMDQIGHNSDIIGLNRASQLYDKIVEEQRNFSYIMTYYNYSDLLNITSVDKIYSFWVFNYPRRSTAINSITDISKNGYGLSSDQSINLYERNYSGFMSLLKFDSQHYYYLPSDANLTFLNSDGTADVDFTLIFTVKPEGNAAARTLLARSNYATGTHVFEVQERTDNSLYVRLFADTNNYITFVTGADTIPETEHSLVLSYKAEDHTMQAYIGGEKAHIAKEVTGTYDHMSATSTTLYAFSSTPQEIKYANSSTAPTTLYNADGTANTDSNWSTSNNSVFYKDNLTTYSPSNYTVVGSPTITDDGILNQYTYAQALNTNIDLSTYNSWKVSFPFIFNNTTNDWTTLINTLNRDSIKVFNVSSLSSFRWVLTDGDGNTIISTDYMNLASATGDNMFFEAEFTGSQYNIVIQNLSKGTQISTSTNSTARIKSGNLLIGYGTTNAGTTCHHQIDLKAFSITVDGEEVYRAFRNKVLPIMYAWSYSDGATTHTIYEKDSTITATTKLYNADYSEYTGSDFVVVQSGSNYIVQYLGNDTTAGTNIPAKTIYAFLYTANTEYVWANSSTTPVILYNSSGNLYSGTDWVIVNNAIKFKGYSSSYSSAHNMSIPALEVTSYITDVLGNKSQYVNSSLGVISVVKTLLTEDQIREISLILQASLGKNPCMETC